MKTCGLLIMCGIPGSGKTFVAKQLCQNESEMSPDQRTDKSALGSLSADSDHTSPLCHNTHFVHICYDRILPQTVEADIIADIRHRAMSDTEAVSPWKVYRWSIVKCVEQLLGTLCGNEDVCGDIDPVIYEQFKASVQTCKAEEMEADNVILVVDDNMYYRSMRYEYYRLARKYLTGFCQCHMDCSLETASNRNRLRGNQVQEDVIVAMKAKLEAPDQLNLWEKFTLTINTDEAKTSLSNLHELISTSLANPVQPLAEADAAEVEESRVQCSTSVIHQSDQILRHLVALHMSRAKSSGQTQDLKTLARVINVRRTTILEKMKRGQILLPADLQMAPHAAKDQNSTFYRFIERLFDEQIS